ncbi:tetratricopeptide repeat protein [Pelagicoccus sp. SDUM812002]|uniref:tetratricopeptide repeat protein n=1 Tax=Pelagicoccus sp. SDUM812002 TaxID=3041266 RepID=UPI00280F6068|nr:tetratricopeptide repeat protein [Pelagicoccus sp. SDUM812002]MDQ8186830.1 tetratricopeptide repeat protein [Pelagicoccus sp. SDUM812002]
MTFNTSRTGLFTASGNLAIGSHLLASPEDFVERGHTLMQLSQKEIGLEYYEQAAYVFAEALEIDPENSKARLGLALAMNTNCNFNTDYHQIADTKQESVSKNGMFGLPQS